MADPIITVAPPRRETRRGGIKALGEFITTPRLGASAGVQYVSEGCSFPSGAPGLCWGAVVPGDKTTEGLDIELGILTNFGQYVGVECFLGADTAEDYARRARNLLVQTEEHEVEAAIQTWGALAPTPGAATTFAGGIALADAQADQSYVGRPVIFLNRGDAVLAAAEGAIEGDRDGNMWTINGTPVVSSWTIGVGEVIVTGWPTVYVSDIEVVTSIQPSTNREMAIAERVYGVAVDCNFRYLVNVTV